MIPSVCPCAVFNENKACLLRRDDEDDDELELIETLDDECEMGRAEPPCL